MQSGAVSTKKVEKVSEKNTHLALQVINFNKITSLFFI